MFVSLYINCIYYMSMYMIYTTCTMYINCDFFYPFRLVQISHINNKKRLCYWYFYYFFFIKSHRKSTCEIFSFSLKSLWSFLFKTFQRLSHWYSIQLIQRFNMHLHGNGWYLVKGLHIDFNVHIKIKKLKYFS